MQQKDINVSGPSASANSNLCFIGAILYYHWTAWVSATHTLSVLWRHTHQPFLVIMMTIKLIIYHITSIFVVFVRVVFCFIRLWRIFLTPLFLFYLCAFRTGWVSLPLRAGTGGNSDPDLALRTDRRTVRLNQPQLPWCRIRRIRRQFRLLNQPQRPWCRIRPIRYCRTEMS